MDRVIFADCTPGFLSDNCIFFYAPFFETSRAGNTKVTLLCVLEWKTTHALIHHCNINNLQYIPVNTSYFELSQLSLRSELGNPLVIKKKVWLWLHVNSHPFSEMLNKKKIHLFFLILILMLLLLDRDSCVMEGLLKKSVVSVVLRLWQLACYMVSPCTTPC